MIKHCYRRYFVDNLAEEDQRPKPQIHISDASGIADKKSSRAQDDLVSDLVFAYLGLHP